MKHIFVRPKHFYTSPVLTPQGPDEKFVNNILNYVIGKLCGPCGRVKRKDDKEERVYVLTRRNSKGYADIGFSLKATKCYTAILLTRSGLGFICRSDLPPGTMLLVRAPPFIPVKDANGKQLLLMGQICLQVRLGSKRDLVRFYVTIKLCTLMTLDCDFCDKNVDAIRSPLNIVDLDDGTTVPIALKLSSRRPNAQPLPTDQEHIIQIQTKHVSPKIQVHSRTTLTQDSQTLGASEDEENSARSSYIHAAIV